MNNYTDENKNSLEALEELKEEELLELHQIQTTLEQRQKSNPLKYFWPHQRECNGVNCGQAQITYQTYDGKRYSIRGCPQFEFQNTTADISAFFGSNRAGKTTSGAVKVGFLTTGEYPSWYKGRRWERPTTGRIFAKDFAKGAKVTAKKLKEWLPKASIVDIKKNNQGAEVEWTIRHKDGGLSYFDQMTYEQDSDSAEGADKDWVWFDEPPPRAMYIAATRGLIDHDGICMFTLTPLKEPWLFDEVYNSKNHNVKSILCDMRHNLYRYNPLSHVYIGLKEASIQKFEMKLTEEERETRMHGKFRYLAGRIWKEWDRGVHTFKRDQWVTGVRGVVVDGQPPQNWPRCMVIDPHDRNPHALIWVALDETDESWVYREAFLAEHTIEDVVEYIKNVELNNREKVQLRIIDPNFGPKKYANTGNTVRDEFEHAGRKLNYPVRFTFGDDHKEVARKTVANMLRFDRAKPLNLMNHPLLHIADDLKQCIYQVEHYIWDEYKTEGRDPKEKPKDIYTHMPDVLQYYALSGFRWRKPEISAGKGSFYV